MSRYSYLITLQNGEPIYCSKDDKLFFSTKESALRDTFKKINDIVESQDCEAEDRFTEGDFRWRIINHN